MSKVLRVWLARLSQDEATPWGQWLVAATTSLCFQQCRSAVARETYDGARVDAVGDKNCRYAGYPHTVLLLWLSTGA